MGVSLSGITSGNLIIHYHSPWSRVEIVGKTLSDWHAGGGSTDWLVPYVDHGDQEEAAPPAAVDLPLVGTPQADDLTGTAEDDTISALASDDIVRGLGGDDILSGGDGADTLSGGDGEGDQRMTA